MEINTDPQKIEEILSRGVEDVFVADSLKTKLLSGKQLRIKFGIDPTSPNVHLGRAVVLRKLKAFQDLGHHIVLLIGDFTALIGDPSDKLSKRPMLTKEDVERNMDGYQKQLGKIVDLDKVEFVHNSEWLGKLGFAEISQLAESFTVQQMSSRRNFKERLDKGEEISLREFLYPLMQGYDSVAVKADIEIGGLDQLFNLKAGRVIQKYYNQPEQDVLTCQMLEGTDGRKMSSSWGNVISLNDAPNEMLGKIMSMRDELILKYYVLCTDISTEEINKIEEDIKSDKLNPRDAKMQLAKEVVRMYHGEEEANKAEEYFITAFQKKEIPDDIQEVKIKSGVKLVDLLLEQGIVKSKSDFRRLIDEGAIGFMDAEKISDPNFVLEQEGVLKIGKKRFIKIIL